jgi:hypothetical protein
MGSSIFFSEFDDYVVKDYDWLVIIDTKRDINSVRFKIKDDDIYLYKKEYTKADYIDNARNSGVPMKSAKFIAPEFIEYFNVTIKDLIDLEDVFNRLDDKHKYIKTIADAYIENNSFTLTEDQLKNAYDVYKKYRQK